MMITAKTAKEIDMQKRVVVVIDSSDAVEMEIGESALEFWLAAKDSIEALVDAQFSIDPYSGEKGDLALCVDGIPHGAFDLIQTMTFGFSAGLQMGKFGVSGEEVLTGV